MNLLNLKLSIYILVSGLLCGFFAAILFLTTDNDPSPPSQKLPTEKKKALRNIAVLEKTYQSRLTVLQNKNSVLQQRLTATQSQLEEAKRSVKHRETTVKKLVQVEERSKPKSLFKTHSIALFDSLECECDSLKHEVINYINENHRKDSLYETQLATMGSVVYIKDSIILANERFNNTLDSIFHQAIAIQGILQNENKLLKKQEKKRKVKNRLLGAGLLIISGSIIHFLHR